LREQCARGFEIITGRVSDDSLSEGMAAGAVLFAAMGLCTGTRVAEQVKNRNWEAGTIRVNVRTKVSKDMNRATEITMEVDLEADLTEEQRQKMLKEARRCFVSNTIKNTPEVRVELKLI
jgi:uncharacterized OsmC-like protein